MNATRILRNTLLSATLALVSCTSGVEDPGPDEEPGDFQVGPLPGDDLGPQDEWDEALDAREVDYGHALRIASLKLTGDLPTLAEIKFVSEAADQKLAYEAVIDGYLEDPRFTRMIRNFWR